MKANDVGKGFAVKPVLKKRHACRREFHPDKEAQEGRCDDKNSLGERLEIELQGRTLAQILNHQMG